MNRPSAVSGDTWGSRDYSYILGVFALVWCVHAVWLSMDTRPPVWDMALHQTYALNYLPGESAPGNVAAFWARSGNYPPLVHILMAATFALLHPGPHIAILANVPATLILLWAVYRLAFVWSGRGAARWSCLVASLVPYLLWMSRETVLDYWLSAWVAAFVVALIETRGFSGRLPSAILGLVMALGLLTKWMFAGFVVAPLLMELFRHRVWRAPERRIHFADSMLIAGGLAGLWYLPNLPGILRFFVENSKIGAREGEPAVFSFQSWIYYLRLLEGYQLFAFLFIVLILAVLSLARRGLFTEGRLLAATVVSGWIAMTLLRTKDPRFTMPSLALLAVPVGVWMESWGRGAPARVARSIVLAVLLFQGYMINFGISWLPDRVVIAEGYQGSLRWDWNLYLQSYFQILGQPRTEDWKQAEILVAMSEHARQNGLRKSLALIPDLPRFNAANFSLYGRLLRVPAFVDHPQQIREGLRTFERFDYAVMTEGDQGMPWTTAESRSMNQLIVDSPEVFRLMNIYPLPSGDSARLYWIRRE